MRCDVRGVRGRIAEGSAAQEGLRRTAASREGVNADGSLSAFEFFRAMIVRYSSRRWPTCWPPPPGGYLNGTDRQEVESVNQATQNSSQKDRGCGKNNADARLSRPSCGTCASVLGRARPPARTPRRGLVQGRAGTSRQGILSNAFIRFLTSVVKLRCEVGSAGSRLRDFVCCG